MNLSFWKKKKKNKIIWEINCPARAEEQFGFLRIHMYEKLSMTDKRLISVFIWISSERQKVFFLFSLLFSFISFHWNGMKFVCLAFRAFFFSLNFLLFLIDKGSVYGLPICKLLFSSSLYHTLVWWFTL